MKAWQLLDSREKWCQGGYGKRANGTFTDATAPDVVQWCTVGAITKCYRQEQAWEDAYNKLGDRVVSISGWNDAPERTWKEVHALLKELDI